MRSRGGTPDGNFPRANSGKPRRGGGGRARSGGAELATVAARTLARVFRISIAVSRLSSAVGNGGRAGIPEAEVADGETGCAIMALWRLHSSQSLQSWQNWLILNCGKSGCCGR